MDRGRVLSMVGLLTAVAVTFGLVQLRPGWLHGNAEVSQPKPPALNGGNTRQTLRTYFMEHYSEGSCSAVYVDLTHNGEEELLVLTVEDSRTGEPVSLHGEPLDADCFTSAQATVLRADDGEVHPIYEFTCGAEHSQWGELYLKKEDGADYLLWYAPYTGAGRADFQIALFSLAEDGAVLDRARERISFPAGDGVFQEGDADAAMISAFLDQAAALLEDAQPVIVYDMIYDSAAGTDGPRRFAYLDALFTSY